MKKMLDSVTEYFIRQGYINTDDSVVFRYAIEKRMIRIGIAVPFLIVGIAVSSLATALVFLLSFYYLREYTNGIHANDIQICLLTSLVSEIIFLGLLPRIMDSSMIMHLAILNVPVVFSLAPYKCPQMNYTDAEVDACAHVAKRRTIIVCVIFLFLNIIDLKEIALGFELGLVMTSFLLVIAYFKRSALYE